MLVVMLGVFEINPEHKFYHLTAMIKEGMNTSIQTSMDTPIQETLTAEHFKAEETQSHEGFEMQTFAPQVFAKLRRSLDITEEEYRNSLCSDGDYLQFVSNSKSKADFFITNDKRFFLKTQSRREVSFLLSNLQAYMDHLEKYPHSLMVRFLGKSNSDKHNFESTHPKKYLQCTSRLSPSQLGSAVAPCDPLKGKQL
ncbi:phosphatidylinositol 4-phosphate 5-kinase-like protein 1 [Acanthopagrus latus]|uniref:phosphatidylinositol 4-phosphate 5-kinase-like protein 1 n=1 Tax=Acanthopagrus latus TaxID=8177 RepID=UPI00187CF555|nr:phosphatidylinositol 4-phosphate 5-kinase-like protein 1 [Acanthopagrus latus]